MGLGHRADDREPEPGAATVVPRGRRARTARSAGPRRGLQRRPGVGRPSARARPSCLAGAHVDVPAGAVVAHGVLDQVGHQPLQQPPVAGDARGCEVPAQRAPGRRRASPRPRRAATSAPGRPARRARPGAGCAPAPSGPSSSASVRSAASITPAPIARSSSHSASGSASATSASVRITVSGRRSSWLALATKRRCASKAARASRASSRAPASDPAQTRRPTEGRADQRQQVLQRASWLQRRPARSGGAASVRSRWRPSSQ